MKTVLLAALVLLLCSCAHLKERELDETVGAIEYPDGLFVELSSETTEFASAKSSKIAARVMNRGSDPITFHDHDLVHRFALEVRDAADNIMPLLPPPTPITKRQLPQYRRSLEPGDGYDFAYALSSLTPPVPDGTYTARVRVIPDVPSNLLTFRIRNDDRLQRHR